MPTTASQQGAHFLEKRGARVVLRAGERTGGPERVVGLPVGIGLTLTQHDFTGELVLFRGHPSSLPLHLYISTLLIAGLLLSTCEVHKYS